MSWSTFQIVVVIGMVATGTLNTISAGFQQRASGFGKNYPLHYNDDQVAWMNGTDKTFDHPYLQAMGMMAGETLCMIAFVIMTCVFRQGRQTAEIAEQNKGFSPFMLYPAALFDLIGTSLNYVGMILSYPSSFQMLRGSVIVFTAALSIVILRQRPKPFQWLGIFIIIGGLVIVGIGDLLYTEEDLCQVLEIEANATVRPASTYCTPSKLGSNPLVGDIIIIVGEVFHAFQFIYEEYVLGKYNLPPLQVVGYEGIFGFSTIGILLWPMYFIYTGESFGLGPELRFEDAIDGFTQIANSASILGWTFGNMISIACFNFAGITVTKELTSTTRAVLDNIRQIFIWVFSLSFGWQSFNPLTPVGFVVLIVGMWIYNDVILRPALYKFILKKQPPTYETAKNEKELELEAKD